MRPAGGHVQHWEDFCEETFGTHIFPDTDHHNTLFGGTNPATTKIVFTNGQEDPWQHSSITKTDNPELIPILIECDHCSHCQDLHGDYDTDEPELTAARARITAIFEEWIAEELAHEGSYPTEDKASLRELLSK